MMIAAMRAGKSYDRLGVQYPAVRVDPGQHVRIGDRLALHIEVTGLGVDEYCRALVGGVVGIDANRTSALWERTAGDHKTEPRDLHLSGSGWPDLNRRPLRPEHGVSGNDEPTLPATDGPPASHTPSGQFGKTSRRWARNRMAEARQNLVPA